MIFSTLTFIRPGCGALGRNGDFWYPVRLILKDDSANTWRIKWLTGCKFKDAEIVPGSITTVAASRTDLVDGLWLDRAERRKIKVKCTLKLEPTQTYRDLTIAWMLDSRSRYSDIRGRAF